MQLHSDGMRPDLGQTGRCPEAGNQTAISRFPAVQRWMVANGSFSVQRMRTPDPVQTFVARVW